MNVSPVLNAMQQEQIQEANRKMAMRSGGHKFIRLILTQNRFTNISGVEIVNAISYFDEDMGVEKYSLQVTTGELQFELDRGKNVFLYDMLDSEHNRNFLVSHYHSGLWDIEDEKIDSEIKKASKALEERLKRQVEERDKPPKTVKKAPAKKAPVKPPEPKPSDIVTFTSSARQGAGVRKP